MILGITGNIASGKSTAGSFFEQQGAIRICADELAREVVAPGSLGLRAVIERFGAELLDEGGALNRQMLASIVFADPEARRDLEAITHPAIAALSRQRLAAARHCGASLVVYEAPLLFEAGAQDRVDRVLVVSVDSQVQLSRLMARDGFTRTEALQRIEAQMPQDEKVSRADYLIDNSGSKEQFVEQLRALWRRLAPQGDPSPTF